MRLADGIIQDVVRLRSDFKILIPNQIHSLSKNLDAMKKGMIQMLLDYNIQLFRQSSDFDSKIKDLGATQEFRLHSAIVAIATLLSTKDESQKAEELKRIAGFIEDAKGGVGGMDLEVIASWYDNAVEEDDGEGEEIDGSLFSQGRKRQLSDLAGDQGTSRQKRVRSTPSEGIQGIEVEAERDPSGREMAGALSNENERREESIRVEHVPEEGQGRSVNQIRLGNSSKSVPEQGLVGVRLLY
ncbi:hypothetical protein MBM_02964 [Drepanopeziza brunnea f. sp. 'multigermtubi' MB_m1]|uniref:Uncharacterized protein n=1 Tax=Marssonina brunnea f. sp. multigermtubi (strain MB_m1) TaxID=1072389 RepID=K1X149_MARBU|nr:uncharacterized protein MBM_02964 [Drepanopeziza brunnea f. sp. 'multigermtubi' MB_m1]EKD18722.1 hypothetical protein MBM_02964 [Drepanopeziza brunnea f. sp. 'multigermtubi' MB_m1]